jgi:hypothetical protein
LNGRKENRNHHEKTAKPFDVIAVIPSKGAPEMNLALAALLLVVPAFAVSSDCWDVRHFRSEMQREAREMRRDAYDARMEAHREALQARREALQVRMDARRELRQAREEARHELERARQRAREEAREFRRSFRY